MKGEMTMHQHALRRSFLGRLGQTALGVVSWGYTPWAGAASGRAMLATPWPTQADPAPYWVSEKLDGVRALWDGQTLRFRSGRTLLAPAWFTAQWPAQALDGELWMGHQTFDRVSAAVRRSLPDETEWRSLRYMVFDAPDRTSNFTERLAHIQRLLGPSEPGRLGAWVQSVAQFRVADAAELTQHLSRVLGAGGEGLVLHHADALWQAGRSETLRKFKSVQDEEARVVAHLPGKGRLQGRLGALLVEMPSGQRFALGSGLTDADREKPPRVGAWVSYRYRDRTPSGLPRFATYWRERPPE